MAHTPFFENVRRIARDARVSAISGLDVEQVWEKRSAAAITRRRFLESTAIAATAMAAAPLVRAAKPSATTKRVVVVGAGLAGLTCAYRLKQAGIEATVYEAQARVG